MKNNKSDDFVITIYMNKYRNRLVSVRFSFSLSPSLSPLL